MNIFIYKMIFGFFIAFLITFYLIPVISSWAIRLNFVDIPDGKIKQHAHPVPYLGGVALYMGFMSSLVLVLPVENRGYLLLLGSTLLLFVGLIDDLVVLKPYQKLFGQCIACLCFLKTGLYLKEQFFYAFWRIPFSILWMLMIINAFNLVDVMDGLATTLALFAGMAFLALALFEQQEAVALLLCPFMGALIAFFWFNKPPARIYLGDAGSLLIGGILATVPFLLNWGTFSAYGYLAPLIILAIPLIEVATLVCVRTYKGIPFYKPSPDHFALYLIKNGWSKKNILLFTAFLALILGFVANLLVLDQISLKSVGFIGLIVGLCWNVAIWCKLR